MTIRVSADKWPLARNLTLSEDSSGYQTAMRCLLLGSGGKLPLHRGEWRFHSPRVSAEGDWVTVHYDAVAWIQRAETILVGPWKIVVSQHEQNWRVSLQPPNMLVNTRWEHIEVRLAGLGVDSVSPPPSAADEGGLVWSKQWPRGVQVDVAPPWQRSFVLSDEWSVLGAAGVSSWWVCASVVIAVAALRASPARPSAGSAPLEENERASKWRVSGKTGGSAYQGLTRAALHWAVLSGAIALTLLLLEPETRLPPSWRTGTGVVAGLALVLVARPWCRTFSGGAAMSGDSEYVDPQGVQRRQALVVTAAASAVAVIGLLVVLVPRFHILGAKGGLELPALVGLVSSGLATLWLWLAALVAWAWRFAREAGMIRKSWAARWDDAPVRCMAAVAALLTVMAAAVVACFWWAHRLQWKRRQWLRGNGGIAFETDLSKFLREFPFTGLRLVYAYTWMLTGVALVALLHARVKGWHSRAERRQQRLSLGPAHTDLLLVVTIFAFFVGLRQVVFAGSLALYALWLVLIMLSLYGVLVVGRRLSVLGPTGTHFRMHMFGTPQRRRELLRRAQHYRNVHQQLYLHDRGRSEGTTREQLEDQLRQLDQWLFATQGHPTAQVSVLDVVLGWGPADHWWDNARYAARLAFCFGVPASAAVVWLNYLSSPQKRTITLHDAVGLPRLAAEFLAWQVAWAGAGMALGALWRLLPGRRSPVRALSLTAAYAIPVCVGVLLSRFTDSGIGYALLNVLFMLIVLTLTSMWMDMASFSEERKFWSTRFGLLLSIYQMRGVSAQFAYIAAQVAVAVSIWRQVAEGAPLR